MFENFKVPSELIPSDPRFGVGPSLVPVEAIQALAKTGTELLGTSHRKPAVKNLVKEVQEGLQAYFNLPEDYLVVLGNGGATFLWDMMATGMAQKKTYHYVSGEFSNKWYKAHKLAPWLEVEAKISEYGSNSEIVDVEGYDMICATLNETSTGAMIETLPYKVREDAILAVDATSGAGQMPQHIPSTDFYYFSPQKVFAAEGGLFLGFMSPKAQERVLKINENPDRYIPEIMNWKLAIDNSKKNQTYNTPSVSNLFFLNEQVKLMNKLGEKKVYEMAREKADMVYAWAEEKEYLSPFVSENHYRSVSVATIDVDDKYPVGDLTKVLRDSGAVYDIDAYRKLGRNQLRISLFHNVTKENLEKLTKIISLAIESEA